ncbi:hypothetical protein BD324DRAFT_458933 [Kockovaella imperatae]|uniref:Uncharacterized protein n=1 Tax=Kockovaella imperatae TaxID=4999 RepID=A0A1Y1UF58_9TREE|nr:hypothetical protein BD324DRAFT_458933 [Kockovaella imperatae]ORX36648.1 hypothetical protein BD324DRAFT_458933 [Kockovaella imperatae]
MGELNTGMIQSSFPQGIFSDDAEHDVTVTASFPESNPFGLIVNGEQTGLFIHLDNTGSKNYTLVSAAASFHNVENNWALIKNASTLRYNVNLLSGSNLTAPYQVFSEFRPQEMGLTVWVNLVDASTKEVSRVTAMNQTISVVEQPASWADPQLLLLFVILGAALLGGAYAAYSSFFDAGSKKSKGTKKRTTVVTAKESAVPGQPAAKSFEEDWIPAHHLKAKSKPRRRDGGNTSGGEDLTSGGEVTSGAESGPEGKVRRRKAKKA